MFNRMKGWLSRIARSAGRPPGNGLGDTAVPGPRAASQGEERWDEILRVQELSLNLLSNKVTPDELFRHVVDGAADSLGADEASLMLVEGDDLRVASSTRTPAGEAEPWQQRSRLGEGVAGWVAQTGSPVLLSEGDDLSRFPNLVPKGGRIQSAVSVPLEGGGRARLGAVWWESSTRTAWPTGPASPRATSPSSVSSRALPRSRSTRRVSSSGPRRAPGPSRHYWLSSTRSSRARSRPGRCEPSCRDSPRRSARARRSPSSRPPPTARLSRPSRAGTPVRSIRERSRAPRFT